MATQPIIPIRSSTQSFTEIEDIQNNIVIFTDGSACMVISVAAVNFSLLSEKEQEAMIYSYAGLLNSLSFPIQIVIRSEHKDVSAYLHLLSERETHQKNPKLAKSIHDYRMFVSTMVKEKNVLDKKFYVVIPFSSLEIGTSASVLFGNKRRGLPMPKETILERAITILTPKKDHLIRLLNRVGLRASFLDNEQLIKLFFTIYNSGTTTVTHTQAPNENPNEKQHQVDTLVRDVLTK